jgi:pSer/pThr/pTyr-binding forkhead associated (FHA) protein
MSVAVVEIHPARGRERQLAGQGVIGRAADCAVQLDDPLVSRRHARILSGELGTAIEDLDSSNGLYVNGRRVCEITPLHPGDVIALGATVWLVRTDGAVSSAERATARRRRSHG